MYPNVNLQKKQNKSLILWFFSTRFAGRLKQKVKQTKRKFIFMLRNRVWPWNHLAAVGFCVNIIWSVDRNTLASGLKESSHWIFTVLQNWGAFRCLVRCNISQRPEETQPDIPWDPSCEQHQILPVRQIKIFPSCLFYIIHGLWLVLCGVLHCKCYTTILIVVYSFGLCCNIKN